MNVFLFFYNLLLTITCIVNAIGFYLLFRNGKNPVFRWVAVTFALFSADNLLFYMDEFLPGTADFFSRQFLFSCVSSLIGLGILYAYRRTLTADDNIKPPSWENIGFILLSLGYILLSANKSQSAAIVLLILRCGSSLLIVIISLWQRHHSPQPHYTLSTLFVKMALLFQVLEFIERLWSFLKSGTISPQRILSLEIMSVLFCIAGVRKLTLENKTIKLQNEEHTRTSREEALNHFASEYGLTQRECEVMSCLVDGMRNSDIAEHLFISEGTVKTHLHNIFLKADVNGRFALLEKFHLY